MVTLRCDRCGKFTRYLNAIWCNPPGNGIDCEVCDPCYWKTLNAEAGDAQ